MLLDRFLRFRHKSKKHRKDDTLSNLVVKDQAAETSPGILTGASDFTINGGQFINHPKTYNIINSGEGVLQFMIPRICGDATTDALVRSPPPRCLPGTRERILDILNKWLINYLWMIVWLSGPAGAGKSAVAQTFAEECAKRKRLGAAYFFIRSSKSHHPRTLIPTLAYQLAINVPGYKEILGNAIHDDPSIFNKALQVQMQKLIVEPFTALQTQKPKIAQNPFFIIIDGLDECEGEEAQCDIVEIIGEVVRLKKDLPLRWFIASRPEFHLQYTFSQPDLAIDYHKEVLLIDADTIKDVNLYLRHTLENIRTKSSINAPWPPELDMRRLEDIASGLFILAATIVRYVSDVKYRNPQRRLRDFFAFMNREDRATTTNPLDTLDQLYSQILSEIPKDVFPITMRILALHTVGFIASYDVSVTCTLLRIDQDEFHDAVERLHSLFDIPPRDVNRPVQPYHASFGDHLRLQHRSREFHVSNHDFGKSCAKEFLFWYKTVLEDPCWISDDSFSSILKSVGNTVLPGVVWDSVKTSNIVRRVVSFLFWNVLGQLGLPLNTELLVGFKDFDFRYILVSARDKQAFALFINDWHRHTTLVHAKPQDQLEEALLGKVLSDVSRPMERAMLPIDCLETDHPEPPYQYVFIGRGMRSCLFWFDENCSLAGRCRLRCKVAPKKRYLISDCVIHFPEKIRI